MIFRIVSAIILLQSLAGLIISFLLFDESLSNLQKRNRIAFSMNLIFTVVVFALNNQAMNGQKSQSQYSGMKIFFFIISMIFILIAFSA